jgi:8-oxo-dGTP pyrophosphatase MutT (NUDIX family)
MSDLKHEFRQIAALPYFVTPAGQVNFCLVTSRGSGRWIIPKGNPIEGLSPHQVAAREALEEAGLIGRANHECIGFFDFIRNRGGKEETCVVDVYGLRIERQLADWAEKDQRSVLSCGLELARSLVCSPSLAALIAQFVRPEHRIPTESPYGALSAF